MTTPRSMTALTRTRGAAIAGALALAAALAAPLAGQTVATDEKVDFDAIFRIKDEGFQRPHAMEALSYMTDVHGPRLTNSPGMRASAEYVKKYLASIGLINPRFEAWGPFGRGWANERTAVHVTSPQTFRSSPTRRPGRREQRVWSRAKPSR
jgi:carboxypeptidase Q